MWALVTLYTYYNSAIIFDSAEACFKIISNRATNTGFGTNSNYYIPITLPSTASNMVLFRVTGSDALTDKMNIVPSETVKTFDPSTHVLFANANSDAYTLTPLSSLKWNSGEGEYLTQLNHAVKMYRTIEEGFQLKLSNTFLDDWFGIGGRYDTNNGGVVVAPMGTTGINYTVPAGTIAFYINEVPQGEPSYINIIVAINPEQTAKSNIALWGPMNSSGATVEFDLNKPDQQFPVPQSVSATDDSYKANYTTKISAYYNEGEIKGTDDPTACDYYTYLGGKIAFVAYSFSVTKPGIYLIGSRTGPMSVAYFSVAGAAGAGSDGMAGSPLGDIDFVYDNGSDTIISVDKKFTGEHIVSTETPATVYYPSYYFAQMLPKIKDDKGATLATPITFEDNILSIRRCIVAASDEEHRRRIRITGTDTDTKSVCLSSIYGDIKLTQ